MAASSGGLGSLNGNYSLKLGIGTDPNGTQGPYSSFRPNAQFFVNVCGLNQKTDWVETNWVNMDSVGVSDSAYPENWTPQFSSRPDLSQIAASAGKGWTAAQFNANAAVRNIYGTGCWQRGVFAPAAAGVYTLIVAVNGQIQFRQQFSVGGAPIPSGFQISPVADTSTAATSATASAQQAAASPSTTTALALVPQTSGATTQTAVATSSGTSDFSSLIPSSITSLFSGTMFGIPTWILLAGGVAAVWYFSTRK